MAKSTFVELALYLINFIFTLCGFWVLGFAFYFFVNLEEAPPLSSPPPLSPSGHFARRLFIDFDTSKTFSINLPRAWFIYLLCGIGGSLFIISCIGSIGIASRNPCFLLFYSFFLVVLVMAELGIAAFIYFDHNWTQVMPIDKSGCFHYIYRSLDINWKTVRWAILVMLILQITALTLTLLHLRSQVHRARHSTKSSKDKSVDESSHLARRRLPVRKSSSNTGLQSNVTSASHSESKLKGERSGVHA